MPEEVLEVLQEVFLIYYLGLYLEPRCHCLIKSAAEKAAAILKHHRSSVLPNPNAIN